MKENEKGCRCIVFIMGGNGEKRCNYPPAARGATVEASRSEDEKLTLSGISSVVLKSLNTYIDLILMTLSYCF